MCEAVFQVDSISLVFCIYHTATPATFLFLLDSSRSSAAVFWRYGAFGLLRRYYITKGGYAYVTHLISHQIVICQIMEYLHDYIYA